jgi:hypothetical protein
MPRGDDTRHHSNRKVTKEALGSRYAEIGVGFGDDPRVQKDIAEQQAMWGEVDAAGDRFNGPSEYEEADERNYDERAEDRAEPRTNRDSYDPDKGY